MNINPSIPFPLFDSAKDPNGSMLVSLEYVQKTAAKLLQEYNRRLVTDLGMMRRRDLKTKDLVDIRGILDLANKTAWEAPDSRLSLNDKAYCMGDYYYCYIPCFEEGAYHINSDRYIYWIVKDLDLAAHKMTVHLQDFIYYDAGWQPGIYGDVAFQFADPESEILRAVQEKRAFCCRWKELPGSISDYGQLYRLLDIERFNWPKNERSVWYGTVLKHADAGRNRVEAKSGENNLGNLAAMFLNFTAKTNRILSEYKSAVKSRPVSGQEHRSYLAERKAAPDPKLVPKERRIRVIGNIQVISRTKPKPGQRALANYTKIAWNTRSHFRKLRSGKKVFVKASVHRRKALLTPENQNIVPDDTPLTIKLVENSTNERSGK